MPIHSAIYNSQKVETAQMSINGTMDYQTVVCTKIHYNVDQSQNMTQSARLHTQKKVMYYVIPLTTSKMGESIEADCQEQRGAI